MCRVAVRAGKIGTTKSDGGHPTRLLRVMDACSARHPVGGRAVCCNPMHPRASRGNAWPFPEAAPSESLGFRPVCTRAPTGSRGSRLPFTPRMYGADLGRGCDPAIRYQVATILLPDSADLSRTRCTLAEIKLRKITHLRPALAPEFGRDLSLNLLVVGSIPTRPTIITFGISSGFLG